MPLGNIPILCSLKILHRFWDPSISKGKQEIQDGHRRVYSVFRCHPVSKARGGAQISALYLPIQKPYITSRAVGRKATTPHHGLHEIFPSDGRQQYSPNDKLAY